MLMFYQFTEFLLARQEFDQFDLTLEWDIEIPPASIG
jgi:hypothetical protein